MNGKDVKRRAVTPKQAAEIYGLSVGHLANLRAKSRGCRYFLRGRSVYYRVDQLEEWLFECPQLTMDAIEKNK